jgi:hypothetical protein
LEKTSDKDLEQRMKIRVCVKMIKNETLALLQLGYGEYDMKKSNVQGRTRCATWSRKWEVENEKDRG